MLRAILIDDEGHSLEVLKWELDGLKEDIDILGMYTDPKEGLAAINQKHPDLVFLDIEMPHLSGIELAKRITSTKPQVIFTTAYDQYAIEAIKNRAADYLLKPIQPEELQAALDRCKDASITHLYQEFGELRQLIAHDSPNDQRIIIPTSTGLEFIDPSTIIRCNSESNYTNLFIEDAKPLLVSKTLKEIQGLLDQKAFIRVHNSHLVNFLHIQRYVKADGGYLEMSDGSQVPISRNRKGDLLNQL